MDGETKQIRIKNQFYCASKQDNTLVNKQQTRHKSNMSLAFDENGRPFIILREQEKKKRVKGLEAHKVSPKPYLFLTL